METHFLNPYLSDKTKQSVTCHFPLHTIGNSLIIFILTSFLKLLISSCSRTLLISRTCSLKYFCLKKRNTCNVSLYSVNVCWFIFPVFISWSCIQDFFVTWRPCYLQFVSLWLSQSWSSSSLPWLQSTFKSLLKFTVFLDYQKYWCSFFLPWPELCLVRFIRDF